MIGQTLDRYRIESKLGEGGTFSGTNVNNSENLQRPDTRRRLTPICHLRSDRARRDSKKAPSFSTSISG